MELVVILFLYKTYANIKTFSNQNFILLIADRRVTPMTIWHNNWIRGMGKGFLQPSAIKIWSRTKKD